MNLMFCLAQIYSKGSEYLASLNLPEHYYGPFSLPVPPTSLIP
jgi:hypothetical protein